MQKRRIITVNPSASIEMRQHSNNNGVPYSNVSGDDETPSPKATDKIRKVSMLPLVFLIFYEVSGGPFGVEDSVNAAGPLLALLGFVIFPFIWSIPEALITAEMGTMFPENGGYVVWVSSALGPFWGFQQGWMKWLSGVIDNALYPVLFLDYLKSGVPALASGLPRVAAILVLTLMLTYLNYRGLTIVGWAAVLMGVFSILPFAVMGLISIPQIEPSRWLVMDLGNVNWNLYLNTLFWNLNYWDSISTLAGEVENPNQTLPKALYYGVILVALSYIFPLLTGTGAIPLERELWTDGYFSDVAKALGGAWLRWWVQAAAATSNMGMFLAEMSSDSFQLLGMAERGMIPEFFAKRSRYGTPLLGILFSASGVVLLSWLSFQEIVAAENLLYCVGMILEFIAFVRMRMKHPAASRPYKIPIGTVVFADLVTLDSLTGRVITMRDYNNNDHHYDDVPSPKAATSSVQKVSMIPLVFLIFYEVSGGPFGAEGSVNAAGPLLALLGFLIFPFIWCIPEALITAEMSTMFPINGGFVVWVSSALGPFWGFQVGWMKWLCGVIDNALYPVLFLDYLKSAIPVLSTGLPRVASILFLTLLLTYLNYRGLTIVGWTAVFMGVFSMLPFAVMTLVSIPKLEPSRWFVMDLENVNWNLYLNTLFWNLNYWDSVSTLTGEVANPGQTLPKALCYGVIFVALSNFLPLLAGTGAIPLNRELWTDGYLADVARIIGGGWLRLWVQVAAATSNMGMFIAEMSSDSFQLLGMAELGMLPEVFAERSRYGTPLLAIVFSASGVLLLSGLSFQEIVAAENLLYCGGMILEFIAFVVMRMKYPAASRPYKIPVGNIGSVLVCVPPIVLICFVVVLSTLKVAAVSFVMVIIGFLMRPFLNYMDRKRLLKFSVSSDLPEFEESLI
ncbi:unnamed protein product [Thlaspi arvense]|uniref:Polyamine transporter n=1 Tax=Thlaspi arvense TaxID=13288 RepID=A0AAU9RB77_THLAR|nr:unnamed protein product [Thlaspi arvense]